MNSILIKRKVKIEMIRNLMMAKGFSFWDRRNIINIGITAKITVFVAIEKAKKTDEIFKEFLNKKYKLTKINAIGIISSWPWMYEI